MISPFEGNIDDAPFASTRNPSSLFTSLFTSIVFGLLRTLCVECVWIVAGLGSGRYSGCTRRTGGRTIDCSGELV